MNIFYIESNFHYIIAKNIIQKNNIQPNNRLFVISRGVILDDEYRMQLFYDASALHFIDRLKVALLNRDKICSIIGDSDITIYAPFNKYFPFISYSQDINFIEEGLSSYTNDSVQLNYKGLLADLCKSTIIKVLFPFSKNGLKLYVHGASFSSRKARKNYIIYALSKDSYSYYNLKQYINVVPIKNQIPYMSHRLYKKGDNILVLDRITERGRPFSLDNYEIVLRKIVNSIIDEGSKEIFIKLHPADNGNYCSLTFIQNLFDGKECCYTIIDDNLELLASQSLDLVFWGTNSTVLFYAPILGKNRAKSFASILSDIDQDYQLFLTQWGGVDGFLKLMSNTVEIITR